MRRHAAATVLVVGARDTGKSTLCRFLMEAAIGSGRRAALLDTDLGQKLIGPPACVTMKDPQGLSLAFVGTTNPLQGWRRLIEGTRRLSRRTDADLLVVNTSGLLAGPGRPLKVAKIDALQPDLLMALGDVPDLEAMTRDRPALPILRLPSSPAARRKTDGERRAFRREAFRSYFQAATELRLEGKELQSMKAGAPLPERLLLGLTDAQENDLGLGLLTGASGGMFLNVLSPVARRGIAGITPGLLCLDENFAETSAPAPHGTSG